MKKIRIITGLLLLAAFQIVAGQSIAISGRIAESKEDGTSIYVTLLPSGSGEKFKTPTKLSDWSWSIPFPAGVQLDTILIVDDLHATIKLKNHRTTDYPTTDAYRTLTIDNKDSIILNLKKDTTLTSNSDIIFYHIAETITISGTVKSGSKGTESEIILGGGTIIITLYGDKWKPTIGKNNSETQALLDSITGTVWTTKVKPRLSYWNVDSINDTTVVINLPAIPDYSISSDENISFQIPRSTIDNTSFTFTQPSGMTIKKDPDFSVGGTILSGSRNKDTDIRGTDATRPTITITEPGGSYKWVTPFNNSEKNAINTNIIGDRDWSVVQPSLNTSLSGSTVTVSVPSVPAYSISNDENLTITIIPGLITNWNHPIILSTKPIIKSTSNLSASLTGYGERCKGEISKTRMFLTLTGIPNWTAKVNIDGTFDTTISGINISPYSFMAGRIGVYTLTEVKDGNNNYVPTGNLKSSAQFKENPLPGVSIDAPSGNQSFSITRDSVKLVGNPTGGIFTGPGVTTYDNFFHPKSLQVGDTSFVIYTYRDANGCENKDTSRYIIISGTEEIRFPNGKTKYCHFDNPVTVTGYNQQNRPGNFQYSPDGGLNWYPPAAGTFIENTATNKILFHPGRVAPGKYSFKYYFDTIIIIPPFFLPSLVRLFEVAAEINIIDNPKNINFNYVAERCINATDTIFEGTNLNPPGGKGFFTLVPPNPAALKNDSIISRAILKPSLLSADTFKVKFYYKTLDGCFSDTAIKKLTIHPKPIVDFAALKFYNTQIPIDTFRASQAGATCKFEETYVTNHGNGKATFKTGFPQGEYNISCSYVDLNGCHGDTTKKITLLDPKGEFYGIDNYYCYLGGKNDTIKGLIKETSGNPAFVRFEINRNTFPKLTDSTIVINPSSLRSDTNTVSLIYKIDTAQFTITRIIKVDSIGDFVFGSDLLPAYCHNDAIVNLAPAPPTDNGGMGVFSLIGSGVSIDNKFNPASAKNGIDSIFCTFTRNKSGCKKMSYRTTLVKKLPIPDFTINDKCITGRIIDSSVFINQTAEPDSVVKWKWDFGDVGSGIKNFDTVLSPKHYYSAPGRTSINLKATRDNGCVNDTTIQFSLGQKPIAKFFWINDCFTQGDSIEFVDSTISSSLFTENHFWRFFVKSTPDSLPKYTKNAHVKYLFPDQKDYRVDLVIVTSEGCRDSISQTIHLRPTILVADTAPTPYYMQDFNKGPGNWFPASLSPGSWSYGPVDTIPGTTDSAYFTKIINTQPERSFIISPCFDLRGLDRPMVKMNIKRSFERNRNGAVFQYTCDNGKTWSNIGTDLNDGINWHNSFNIMAGNNGPGGQSIGWTNQDGPFSPDTGWIEARQILKLSQRTGIRFRIAYASEGGTMNKNMRGFSFDNFYLGSRSRQVLVEHFTNTDGSSMSSEDQVLNAVIDTANPKDVIDIRYHLNYPSALDPIYKEGSASPLARSMYYGVIAPTISLIDGGMNDYRFNYVGGNKITNSNINIRVLQDPAFDVFVNAGVSGSDLNISTKMVALNDMPKREVSLHVAIIETAVNGSGNIKFRNVVRQLLPDPSGISYIQSWKAGEFKVNETTWKMSSINDSANLKIVAFVQDENTKEVLQTAVYGANTHFNGMKTATGLGFTVFPNPAHGYVNILFSEEGTHSNRIISIFNVTGVLIRQQKTDSSNGVLTLNVTDLPSGIYFIRISGDTGEADIQKLIIE